VAAIHFPEAEQDYSCLWKMDGPDGRAMTVLF
jgi:hypothetical protein